MHRNVFLSAAIGLSLALAGVSSARGDFIVGPPGLAGAPGNAQGPAPFRFYGSGGSRTQVVYSAATFGTTPQLISAIQFRPYPGSGASGFFGNSVTFSDTSISLSTTTRGGEGPNVLGASFASNIGADVKTVYTGALTLTTAITPAAGGTNAFDYTVNFQTPFLYDPTKGNLLLDVTVPVSATVTGNGAFGFVTFDTANTTNDGIYSLINGTQGDATTGTPDTSGPVTRFTVAAVPEPGGISLIVLGLGGLGVPRLLRRLRTR